DKVVGLVHAIVRERPFYQPTSEGVILDIYLLPLYRRRGVGEYLLRETSEALRAKGAGVVIAEFPAQNEIASRFYAKRGFRPITARHARSLYDPPATLRRAAGSSSDGASPDGRGRSGPPVSATRQGEGGLG
ncbi:GCN5-related N-acetyltransferase, partial [mine drainage metagenome]